MVRADPATSCSWRFGFSQKSKRYECRDGTICSNDNEDCCSSNGGLYRCPYDLPVMCDTATDNLYTCAASVDECTSLALGGARTCQGLATDSTADGCFVSGVSGTTFSTVMTDGTLTESSAEDCQHRCRTTGGCAHFSYYPSSATDNCKLHDSLAVEGNESGTTSGPPTCLASVSTVNNADPDVIGFFRVYYQCTDSTGAQVGLSRLVEVGCEGPNPDGVYGGNIVTCDTVQTGPEKTADYLACLKICTANSVCETYEFYGGIYEDGGNCTTYSGCDGVYSEDTDSNRQVGYCQRINHYPKIYVTASARTMNLGDTSWVEGTVECTDYEDPYPPEPTTVTTFDRDVAGEYVFYYTCEDTIGQQTKGNRTVTVKDNCEEHCHQIARFAGCLDRFLNSDDTDCPSFLPTATASSNSPTYVPTASSLSCDKGVLTPTTYECHAVASAPIYVTYEAQRGTRAACEERNVDSIVVAWSIGDTSDCVFQSWRLQYLLTNSYTGEAAWSEWIEMLGTATPLRNDRDRLETNSETARKGGPRCAAWGGGLPLADQSGDDSVISCTYFSA
ncbi:unnamed protein product [Durusdinium trenchii]|uniref:Apple domain-containing protein n=1 Tax=Durusdinium trenchii TaxID=1381693 RepID=A0ABP0J6V6_9DINO